MENGSSWNQPKLVKALEGVFEVGEPEEIRSTTAVWHPSGKWFVIPTKSHGMSIVSPFGCEVLRSLD